MKRGREGAVTRSAALESTLVRYFLTNREGVETYSDPVGVGPAYPTLRSDQPGPIQMKQRESNADSVGKAPRLEVPGTTFPNQFLTSPGRLSHPLTRSPK